MFIDLPAAVLLLTPMFVPLAAAVGMDTVQLGIMMIVNLSIGLYHPPIGTTLFITSVDRQGAHRRRGEGAHPVLLRRDRPAAGVRLPALAHDPLTRFHDRQGPFDV